MIYFDNAATGGKKPELVETAVLAATKLCANPGRSGHKLSLACANTVQSARNALNSLFDGYAFDRVVFTKNCTEALNLALFGVLKKGDHVVTTCMEHNSILRPLEKLKKDGVIRYDVCPLDENGKLSLSNLQSLIKPNTRLVAVTTASNVNGEVNDIDEVRSVIPKSVLLLCDGAQGGGHLPILMKKSGIDMLALAGHKGLMGIQGSGALLFSERVEPSPILYGGTGSMSVSLDMPDFYPDALEAGTLSYPAIVSLFEGVQYLSTNLSSVQAHAKKLTAYFLKRLKECQDFTPFSLENASGIVAFKHKHIASETISALLSETYDIAVRGGYHCAPLCHQALGTIDDGLVRASFSWFNHENEIDELIFALKDIEQKHKFNAYLPPCF